MGFLGVHFDVGGIMNSLESCQKLEISYVSTYTYVVSENVPFSTKALLILLTSIFGKNNTFIQSNSVKAVLEIFQFCFQFLQDKWLLFFENISFTGCGSGIRLLYCSKLVINQKNYNDVTIYRHDVIVKFFDVILFLLSSLVTSPSFISISSLVLEL